MNRKKITKEKIIQAVLESAFDKSAGNTSLSDISEILHIKKASLYNHFPSRESIFSAAIEYCGLYMKKISFTPRDTEKIIQKYSAEVVLKGIVNRYIKLHEKEPLFQMYTFIQSEKYFDSNAARIALEQENKIINETEELFQSLLRLNKLTLSEKQLSAAARWFCEGFLTMMAAYLTRRKEIMRKNPETGIGSLFALPPDDKTIAEIDTLVQFFMSFIKQAAYGTK
jgi:AcrR family transcriptional regulator